jgi:hypothetical protein
MKKEPGQGYKRQVEKDLSQRRTKLSLTVN